MYNLKKFNMTKLVEGVNIGQLPDPFPFLNNKEILKVKDDISNLSENYKNLYQIIEKTFLDLREVKKG